MINNKLANSVVFIAIVSFLICLLGMSMGGYLLVFFLPLSFCILSLFFYNVFNDLSNSIVFKLFILQSIFRYCFFPMLLSFGQPLGNGESSDYLSISITIIIIELFSVFYIVYFFSKRQKKSFLQKDCRVTPLKKLIPLCLLLVFVFFYIYISGALSKINPIWEFSVYLEEKLSSEIGESSDKFGLILFTPFKVLISLLFISIIYNSNKIKESYKKWLYLFIIFIASIFIVGSSRFSVILFVMPLLILIQNLICKNDYKKILILTLFLLVGVMVSTSVQKFSRYENDIAAVNLLTAASLNSYFAGPGNIAIGLQVFERLSYYDMPLYFINDTFQNVPLLSKLTTSDYKLNNKFNEEIYGHRLYADQIVPLSTSGLFHLGVVGVFFYSSLFIAVALYFERLSYRVGFIGYKYILISLSITLSLVFMLNLGSLQSSLVRSFLFLYLPFAFINFISQVKFKK